MSDFTTPDFLVGYTEDAIYNTMRRLLPTDIDSSEGSHVWNLLRPTAMVAAEMCEQVLPQVIRLIFPMWSYGAFLDSHAAVRGMKRKAATPASGEVTITGQAGTTIPQGSVFATASTSDAYPTVSFATTVEAVIGQNGTVTIPIVCTEAGTVGNTAAETIIFNGSGVVGITSVLNAEATEGGTDEETDDALIARIDEYDKNLSDSFVGNASDYRRWAMSVDGVGNANIIPPTDDSGIIVIALTDKTGNPASTAICEAVYNYIMSPDDMYARLAPINAAIIVMAAINVAVTIRATVEIDAETDIAEVSRAFLVNLESYMPEAMADAEVKYTRIAAALSRTDGVIDYKDLEIAENDGDPDYGTANIPILPNQLPKVSLSDIHLTAGTVE